MASHLPSRTYEPNPALRLIYRWFFDNIQVDDEWVRQVRTLSSRGTVVYVLRSLNLVDFLALDHLTKRFDLPRIHYVNDLRLGALRPMNRGLLHSFTGFSRTSESERLRAALSDGGSAALFLKRPPGVIDVASGASGGRGLQEGDEHVRTLLELQRGQSRPILLVPQVFVWTNRPDTHGSQLLDMVLGPREWPSSFRTLGQALYNYSNVELRAGEPFNLATYLDNAQEVSEDVHVRRVMYAVLRRLERERRTATGPAHKPPDRQRLQVLRSPTLQNTIAQMAGERPEDRSALTQRALKMLRQMQATPDGATIKALDVLLDRVFHRIYAGIDVDREGLRRMRELAKEGSIVLLPSHKSHVDYLVLSFILFENNLQLPMIAAGDNLSFFPLGPVLRRAGGFFIRRSFRGDRLYSTTVEAYVRRLLRDGYTLELFLEGGRSRTGKLLEPKFGLLSMIVDAALSVKNRPVHFVPVSIGYERIVETGSYEHELSGGEKQKEDAAGLLKSTEVLRHRYGRINVQFGQELSIESTREELGYDAVGELAPPKRRAVVTRLANRTMDEINRVTAVTPGALTALALLSDRRRSVAHEELMVRCQKLVRMLHAMGARITPRTAVDGLLRPEAIREAVQMFVDGELVEALRPGDSTPPRTERRELRTGDGMLYRVPERKRLALDTSKNHIIHYFVERGLVALALLHPPGPPIDEDAVRERVQNLSRLFKHEFRFRADAPFDDIFDDTIREMVESGELRRAGGVLEPGEGHDAWPAHVWLQTYASSLRNFVEGYRVAARGLTLLLKGPMTDKDLVKRTLAIGNRMYLSDDVEMRESVSKPLLQNAVLAFREEGYLRAADGKVSLAESFASAEAVGTIEGRLVGFCEFITAK
ncbi:MAG: 1-acyl-sn-glycerol-3-phosphate acyltransferase [Myxococcales bacterium]|jgi:glycerol-3-phosphate O-acyltransferase